MDAREQRYWREISRKNKNGCKLWLGTKTEGGYGTTVYKGWKTTAHRVAYTLTHGPIPEGMVVMHACDVPACCNPDHLSVGTQKENLADMRAKGRHGITRHIGEAHGMCKVTTAQVEEIKQLYATTRLSHRAVGEQYGIGPSQVARIIRGEARLDG